MPSVRGIGSTGCGCLLLVIAINLSLGAMATHYCVEHWFHKVIGYSICMLIGLFAGELLLPAFVVTWLLVLAGIIS